MYLGPPSPAVRLARPLLAALATVAPAAPAALGAQGQTLAAIGGEITRRVNTSMDVGVASVAYDDFLRAAVGSVTPAIRVEGARTLVLARGAYSRFEGGNESVQGTVTGSVVSPELFGVRGEVYGNASATRYRSDLAATNLFAAGRVHAAGPATGAWAGGGLGLVSQGRSLPVDVGQLDLGVWAREGPLTYTLTVQPTRVGATRYGDATLGARWQGTLGELAVSGGYRARVPQDLPGVRAWGEAWGTAWLSRRFALVGGAGTFPYDPVQGLPGGRYLSAALRVAQRRATVLDPALRAALVLPYEVRRLRAAGARAGHFAVTENGDGSRTLQLRVPGARSVELMGDFTDWLPVPLTRLPPNPKIRGQERGASAEVWGVTVVLSPGVHRVNVRVDGGPWVAPPGLSAVRDDFGGAAGLLVVR